MSSRLTRFCWQNVPEGVSVFWPNLAWTMVEGIYLPLKRFAGELPGVALLVGVLLAIVRPGFETLLTQSIVLVTLLLFMGTTTTGLAIWLTFGFASADLVVQLLHHMSNANGDIVSHLGPRALSLLIEYVLLLTLLGFIPSFGMRVANSHRARNLRLFQKLGWTVWQLSIWSAICAVLVYIWIESFPVLIRPVFTWVGESPSRDAIQPIQEHGSILLITVICGSILRICLQKVIPVVLVPPLNLKPVRAEIASNARRLSQLPRPVTVFLRAALITFMLSGLFASLTDATIMLLLLVLVSCMRFRVFNVKYQWMTRISSLPVWLRITIWLVCSCAVSALLLGIQWQSSATMVGFRPLMFAIAASLLLYGVLFPLTQQVQNTSS